jgi:copper(I)-binding protein
MQIVNNGPSPVKLVGGQTPVAERVEIHRMSMEGGVMAMRALPEGLDVPARSTVTLAPGGLHVMMIGLRQPLAEGQSVPLTLIFDTGKRIDVRLAVRSMGAGHGH